MKLLYLYFSILLLISCSGSEESAEDKGLLPINSRYAEGKKVYDRSCIACHMKDGLGLEGTFPPLAKSDYLLTNPGRALQQVIEGSQEEMNVNGVIYNGIMPPQDVTTEEAVEVVNYILNAWGNAGGDMTLSDIKAVKD